MATLRPQRSRRSDLLLPSHCLGNDQRMTCVPTTCMTLPSAFLLLRDGSHNRMFRAATSGAVSGAQKNSHRLHGGWEYEVKDLQREQLRHRPGGWSTCVSNRCQYAALAPSAQSTTDRNPPFAETIFPDFRANARYSTRTPSRAAELCGAPGVQTRRIRAWTASPARSIPAG